ncbi:xylulokinase [Rubritalea marina]|uniref:xylulokinase n=1 Tax=Rubritalea marina TaxID=361055 RepID=UPI00035C811D|nr:FGGY family carbohydrate kinase [Rubritalea marina]
MYLGLDCSTQSLTATLINAESGTVEIQESVHFETELPHYQTHHGFVRGAEPDEFFCDPLMWVEALDLLLEKMKKSNAPLDQIKAISGSAQQHSTVYLNHNFERTLAHLRSDLPLVEQLKDSFTRPVSPIWLDASTVKECDEIIETLGGNRESVQRTGSSIIPRFSASQIRKHAKQFPGHWQDTFKVHLVSSFMGSLMVGHSANIDYGDGAGMNLMHITRRNWDKKMADATAPGTIKRLPGLASTTDIAGTVSHYFTQRYGIPADAKCAHWTGDNPASLVGMGVTTPGEWVISLGTSYTLFSATQTPFVDPQGYGHIFGNPLGNYMSLSCFKNGALACIALKEQLNITWDDFDRALLVPRTPDSPVSLPFYDTEITPPARAVDQSKTTAASLVDGQFLNMRHHSLWHGPAPESIVVTGGISQSDGVCQTIANIFQRPIKRLYTHASASLGAAMIAAYADGHQIEQLAHDFCKSKQRRAITPQPDSEVIYTSLGEKFTELLYR